MGFFSCEVSPMEKPGGNGPTGGFLHSGRAETVVASHLHQSLLTQCERGAFTSRLPRIMIQTHLFKVDFVGFQMSNLHFAGRQRQEEAADSFDAQ